MKKRITIVLLLIIVLAVLVRVSSSEKSQNEPITITIHGSLEVKTIDDLINESELIIIGKVDTILPSVWKAPNGEIPENLTTSVIFKNDMSIVTDHLISIDKILKGDYEESVVRVRSFAGEIDQVRFVSSSEPSFMLEQSYLLFLIQDHGPTQIFNPGDYIPLNAIYGVYVIIDNKAISEGDEWVLEELIAYIQKSLSAKSLIETPISTDLHTEMPSATATP